MYQWLILIYTIPAEPPGSRAYVWRELKKVGAVYLRDGVCLLPDREDLKARMQTIGDRIESFHGKATLILEARLPKGRQAEVVAEFNANRQKEYAEIAHECRGLLDHIRREAEHRQFGFHEVEEIERDMEKIRRWLHQVEARDYFNVPREDDISALLGECGAALASFVKESPHRNEADTSLGNREGGDVR